VSAIAKGIALLNVVTCFPAPIAHLAIVLAPGVHGTIVDGSLSPAPSLAFEVGGLVHVAVNVTTYTGNGIGSR